MSIHGKIEVALGSEHSLNQAVRRDERHRTSRLHKPVPYGVQSVSLARAGQTERQRVDTSIGEVSLARRVSVGRREAVEDGVLGDYGALAVDFTPEHNAVHAIPVLIQDLGNVSLQFK